MDILVILKSFVLLKPKYLHFESFVLAQELVNKSVILCEKSIIIIYIN